MASVFDSMFDAAGAPVLDEHFGVSVIVQRGSRSTAACTVAFNQVLDDVLDVDEDLNTEVQKRIWYPKKSDLVFSDTSSTFEPRIGDLLIVGAEGHQIAPHGNRPAVEEHPNGTRWILRTVRVSR